MKMDFASNALTDTSSLPGGKGGRKDYMKYSIGPLGRTYDHKPECRLCLRGCKGELVCGLYKEEGD
jgi:hypothetical protein